jgi:hypothetical protein
LLPSARSRSSNASRTPCYKRASLESSRPTQTTSPRLASPSTSSQQSAWVCSQRACAIGSRTARQSPSHCPNQKAIQTIQEACPVARPTVLPVTRDLGHLCDEDATPDPDPGPVHEVVHTRAVAHPLATRLVAVGAASRTAPHLTLVRALPLANSNQRETTPLTAHAHPNQNAAAVALRNRYLALHHRSVEHIRVIRLALHHQSVEHIRVIRLARHRHDVESF